VWVAWLLKFGYCTGGGVRGRQMHTKSSAELYFFFGPANRRQGWEKEKISRRKMRRTRVGASGPALPALPATQKLQPSRRSATPILILWRYQPACSRTGVVTQTPVATGNQKGMPPTNHSIRWHQSPPALVDRISGINRQAPFLRNLRSIT
jgi:hypothetical protein